MWKTSWSTIRIVRIKTVNICSHILVTALPISHSIPKVNKTVFYHIIALIQILIHKSPFLKMCGRELDGKTDITFVFVSYKKLPMSPDYHKQRDG